MKFYILKSTYLFYSDPSGGETELLTKKFNLFKLIKSESADHFEHSLEKYSSIKLNSTLNRSSSVASRFVNNYKDIKDDFNKEEILIE